MPFTSKETYALQTIQRHIKAVQYFMDISKKNGFIPCGVIDKEVIIARSQIDRLLSHMTEEGATFPEPSIKSEPECQPINQNSLLSNSQELPSSEELNSSSEVQ